MLLYQPSRPVRAADAEACHLVEGVHVAQQLRWGGALLLCALLQHVAHAHGVPVAVVQDADSGLAVPARSACLLWAAGRVWSRHTFQPFLRGQDYLRRLKEARSGQQHPMD